ncbi:MAG: hypothetical protein KGQ83_09380 [Planctomycetes bacterium]|nr:hypothetical protein [Planctomycetota bacterium]
MLIKLWEILGNIRIDWTAVVAIFTIWLFLYKKKKRVFVDLATEGRRSEDPKIYIIIKNDSEPLITIVRILTREYHKDLIKLSTQDFDLPKTINLHANIQLESPYIAHNIQNIAEIYAEDSTGRRWGVNKKSLMQLRKILRNFIGKRLVYPSMGDELDENKIKHNHQMDMNECHRTLFGLKMFSVCKLSFSFLMSYSKETRGSNFVVNKCLKRGNLKGF